MKLKSIVLSLMLLVALPVMAQDEPQWSAYLYNAPQSQMLIVSPDGEAQTVNLGLPEYAVGSRDFAVTADGSQLAFCLTELGEPDANGIQQNLFTLVVHDIRDNVNTLERELGTGSACRTGAAAFSDDGSKLAVGMIDNFGDNPNQIPWHVYIIAADTGDTLYELNSDSELFDTIGFTEQHGYLMPYVQNFEGDSVSFALVNWFTEGMGSYHAFTWDFAANTLVESSELWGHGSFDALKTTDGWALVYPDLDDSLPVADPGGPMPTANVVKVVNPDGTTTVVYTDEDEVIANVKFINDGSAVAVHLLEGFDPQNMNEPQSTRWIAVHNDGSVTDLTEPLPGPSELMATPGGYVHLLGEMDTETLLVNYTFSANGDLLWTATENMSESSWGLAWTTPVDAVSFTPFAAAQ